MTTVKCKLKSGCSGRDKEGNCISKRADCDMAASPQTSEADVRLNNLLSGLVELKPQISEPELGAEPSIKELIQNYYRDHDIPHWEKLTEQYLKELFNMAT